jgi:hypothetical protein
MSVYLNKFEFEFEFIFNTLLLQIRKRVGIIRKYGNMRSGNPKIRKYEIRKSENTEI